METVTSRDGTTIGFDRLGAGPALILVAGALGTRAHPMFADLAAALTSGFTVINYDRRGRGDSGDRQPYAVAREVEDIAALIDAAGGAAGLFGISSGAVLALEAASALPGRVAALAMYEPPFIVDGSRPPLPVDYVARLTAAVAAGRPGDAVAIFMTDAIGIPAEYVAAMRAAPPPTAGSGMQPPPWAEMVAVAHTLAYDGQIMGDTMRGQPLATARWSGATMPALVLTGGNSAAFFHTGARALVAGLPNARHELLPGQDHAVAPAALAPVLRAFFTGAGVASGSRPAA